MGFSAGPPADRVRLALCCLLAVLALGLVLVAPPQASAQDGENVAAPADPAASAPPAPPKNLFLHIIESLGIGFGLLFLGMSVGMVAMVVLLVMDLRLGAAIPPGFVEDFTETVNKRQFKQAFDLARQDGSYLGRVLTQGMSRLQYGIEDARESAMNTVESIKASKEQLISYLATIGTLGPLFGLVGTVFGMILAFRELGRTGTQPRFDKLSDALSHALVVTMVGIGLAVPAIFCHAFFRNRLIRLSMDTANVADDLLTQMYHNSKRPASAPAANATPTASAVRAAE